MRKISTLLLVVALVGCGDDDMSLDDGGAIDSATDAGGDAGSDEFSFRSDDPSAYTRMDRAGMPFIAAALVTDDDGYNNDDPINDVETIDGLPKWAPEIAGNLAGLHDALQDDFMGASLTPCADFSSGMANALPCALQEVAPGTSVVSLIVPDTLSINTEGARAFPNGRGLPDPVGDVTLAVIFLDLTMHGADTFAAIPLNPAANDVAFGTSFPYLAAPHTP